MLLFSQAGWLAVAWLGGLLLACSRAGARGGDAIHEGQSVVSKDGATGGKVSGRGILALGPGHLFVQVREQLQLGETESAEEVLWGEGRLRRQRRNTRGKKGKKRKHSNTRGKQRSTDTNKGTRKETKAHRDRSITMRSVSKAELMGDRRTVEHEPARQQQPFLPKNNC